MKLKLKNTQVTGLSETQGYLISPKNPVKIKAVPNSKVELFIDGVKQTGSELINGKPAQLKKVDKNLVLSVDGESLVEINDFYDTQGVSLDGTGWQFTNADALGVQEGSVVPLASEEITPQALPLLAVAGAGTGVGALAVLGAVGLAAAAGGGGAGQTAQAAALSKIENYNNSDGTGTNTPVPTVQDYTDATGTTGVNADNLAAVNAQVLKQNPGGAATQAQVLALVASANTALAKIEAYNNGDGTTPPALTLSDYADAGVTGVTADNLAAVNKQVLDQALGGATTDPLIQALVTNVTTAITAIHDAAQNNTATATTPSVATYVTAGVTGVTAGNLAAINSALDSVTVDGSKTNTAAQVQAIVNGYNAILASADGTPSNTTTPLTTTQYTDIGVTNAPSGNALNLLDIVIDGKTVDLVNTVAQVQTLADAAKAVMTGAAGATAPTLTQLGLLGITGVTATNLVAVQAAIDATNDDGSGVNTLAKLQAVANIGEQAAVNALTAIHDAAQNNTATLPTPLTLATYVTAGLTGVTVDNIAAINSALDSAPVDGTKAGTTALVQAIVNDFKAILASADGTAGNTATPITAAQYADIGVTGVTTVPTLNLLDSVIDGKQTADVNTTPAVQTLANAAAAVIGGTGTGTLPTKAQLDLLGVAGVTADNLAAVQAAIKATDDTGTAVDTLTKLQAVVDTGKSNYDAALNAIKAAAEGDTANSTTPSLDTYATAGVIGVTAGNLAAINSALDSTLVNGSKADTTAKVQTLVDAYKAILASADNTGGNTATPITGEQYAAVGVTGVATGTPTPGTALALLDSVVDASPQTAVNLEGNLQKMADASAHVMATAGGSAADAANLSVADLQALGFTTVTSTNIDAVRAAIQAVTPDSSIDSQSELAGIVNNAVGQVATALALISARAEANTAAGATGITPLTATDYSTALVFGVSPTNLAAINSALDSTAITGSLANTTVQLQSIVDAYNAILTAADHTAGSTPLTAAQYTAIGVTGVTGTSNSGTPLHLLDDVVDISFPAAVATESLVQAMATGANHVMAAAVGSSADAAALTLADLSALGINTTGHTIAEIRTALQALTSDASADTQGELQGIISNIPSAQPIFSTNLGIVTDLDVTSNLVLSASSAVNVGTGFIHIKDLGGSNSGSGFHNDTTTNSVEIDVSTAIANGLLSFNANHTKIIINPKYDLDLSSNYSISIDQGAFVDQSTGALSQTLAAVNFSTVTPGTHSTNGTLASDVHASQIMDANGTLQTSKSWIDLESYNTNNTNGLTQIGDLSLGSYALVMKNYATAPGGVYANPDDGGSVGIQLHDVSIGASNFTANDQLYFDSQVNDPAVQRFAPEFISAIQNAGSFTGGVAGQNLLNFDYDPNVSHLGSSNQIALGFQGSVQIFQYIYDYGSFTGLATTLGIPAPVVMG